jgi:hypothetical protein
MKKPACLAYSSTLKMEAACSSEMSDDFHWTAWRYVPEDGTLHHLIVYLQRYGREHGLMARHPGTL